MKKGGIIKPHLETKTKTKYGLVLFKNTYKFSLFD